MINCMGNEEETQYLMLYCLQDSKDWGMNLMNKSFEHKPITLNLIWRYLQIILSR